MDFNLMLLYLKQQFVAAYTALNIRYRTWFSKF